MSIRNPTSDLLASFQKVHNPDARIKDMLPRSLKDILNGRRSTKVQKTRQFFLKFTDRVYRAPGEELWEDLLRTKRFLDLHILLYAKSGDKTDNTPLIFYHSELPEIMLEMIHQSFNSDFFIGSAKMRCVPSLGIAVITSFFYMYSETFIIMPDKFFTDSDYSIVRVSDGAFRDKLQWFDKLSIVMMYGAASFSRACIWFIQQRPSIAYELFTMTYRSMEIVDEKIRNREINWQNETLACFLTSFREDNDLVLTSQFFGVSATNHAVAFFKNIMESTLKDYSIFQMIGKMMMRAEVLKHFSYIVKQVLIWYDPGAYLNTFLAGVSHSLGMKGAVEQLMMENLSYFLEHKYPLGIETFKYWTHETRYPNIVAWFLLHAFSLSKKFGSNWCLCILCHVLNEAEDKMVDQIVENFGLDLMDLAHLIELFTPKRIHVQSTILEALLRYGRIQHKVYDRSEVIEADMKPSENTKEFVLEAALFCKKAQCEAKMSEEEKQRLVVEADLMKDEGNTAFKAGQYTKAIMKYTDAIALCPLSARKKQAIYYSNRAECHLRSKNPKRAIHDCNRSLCLDTAAKVKVQWRRSRAYQKLNLDYPAWLDMKCLEKDWNLSTEQSGVDFNQLLTSLGLQVGILQRKSASSIERRTYSMFTYNL